VKNLAAVCNFAMMMCPRMLGRKKPLDELLDRAVHAILRMHQLGILLSPVCERT
jgi:hypothetical protein